MSHPDSDIFPHATGEAAKTVAAHANDQTDLVFYAGWFCPSAQRSWITLEEKGVPYKYVEINPYHKAPEFLALNPKGLVPTVSVGGKPLYESLILNELFEELFPAPDAPRLLPANLVDKARARIWIDYIAKYVIPAFMRLMMAQTEEDQNTRRQEYYDALRKLTDERDSAGPYFLGEQFSLVDATIAPFVVRDYVLAENRGYVRSDAGEKWVEYAAALETRPSVVRTTSDKIHYAPLYAKYLQNTAQSEFAKALRAGKAF